MNAARATDTVRPAEITIEHLANGTTPPSHIDGSKKSPLLTATNVSEATTPYPTTAVAKSKS